MDGHNFLASVFVFLAAAVIVVPIAKRLGLGSVLGYLLAGIAIGPFGMALITHPEDILHFAEFGVVLMLFLIGMELEPATLWRLRTQILGLGASQVGITALAICGVAMFGFGLAWQEGMAIGLALALSSTAMVMQILEEKNLTKTHPGQCAFSVLLFQDIAVIPIIALLPLLAVYTPEVSADAAAHGHGSDLPAWVEPLKVLGVVGGIVLLGRYVMRHAFRFIANSRLREIFTATSLLLVIGITLLMQALGLSPALGAFIAGVVLANSEYRHALESDIEPFKGLLLGLFFISVGMSIDFDILMAQPDLIPLLVALLLGVKLVILAVLAKLFSQSTWQNVTFSFILSQGGEFAFVLFQFATLEGAVSTEHAAILSAVVAFSMLTTPLLMILNEKIIQPRLSGNQETQPYDEIAVEDHEVIISGYGRFGQVIGRLLNTQGIKVTVLEHDPDQIELLRKFGNKVFYGDGSRLDLMHSAGAEKAKIFVVAVDDPDKAVEMTKLVAEHFPHLKIFARARNRRHAYDLVKAGAHIFQRDTFDSALYMGRQVMEEMGYHAFYARVKAMHFLKHDRATLKKSFEFFEDEEQVINYAKQRTADMEQLLSEDEEDIHQRRNEGWGS